MCIPPGTPPVCSDEGREAKLFTLSVWSDKHAFRVPVRAVGDGQARLFTAAAPLAQVPARAGLAGSSPATTS